MLCDFSVMMAMQRPYNNEIALLRELCAVDSADISGKPNRLSVEIKNLSLKKLVELRNFTTQEGFSKSGDSCYIRIDQLMDDRLLHKAKDWLKKLMKDHFFSRNDYQEFERLDISVGEKIVKRIWGDQDTKKELYRVAGNSPSHVNNLIAYIGKLGRGRYLADFLEGVRKSLC